MSKTFHERLAEQKPAVECTEADPSYWFADPFDEDEPGGKSERAIAITICNRCPLRKACADFAMQENIEYGIYGGMMPQQRKAYKDKRASGIRERERLFGSGGR